jgi:hypothetical protein
MPKRKQPPRRKTAPVYVIPTEDGGELTILMPPEEAEKIEGARPYELK